jgi:hypothetical protein
VARGRSLRGREVCVTLRDDYTGPFDSDIGLESFSRQALAHLGRETLLHGHLQDRVGLPLVAKRFGGDAYLQFSIEEWMGASPIYSRRMQSALGFEGNDVGTVFKNLQLDIGAPHQFMDFQFRLDRPDYGEFWLTHCGALLDVEPFGEERVRMMCHDIEDPTFDATAAATHPAMKMRPIHRPPRVPAGRYPACRWSVFIDDAASDFEFHPNLALVERSRAATVAIEAPAKSADPGGWSDYSGPFDPHFQLEDLSHRALVVANQEFALQSHLLARSFLLSVGQRLDDAAAAELGEAQWTGIAALTAERVRAALRIEGDDVEAIAKLFQLHPCFQPRAYIDFRVELPAADRARISLGRCDALEEGDAYSWFAGLDATPHRALDAIATRVNPRARCLPVVAEGAELAWDVVIDPSAVALEPPMELTLAKISRGATFQFEQRRGLRS